MSYSYDNSHISGVPMSTIPADAASYYATYSLDGSGERRDSSTLNPHGFMHQPHTSYAGTPAQVPSHAPPAQQAQHTQPQHHPHPMAAQSQHSAAAAAAVAAATVSGAGNAYSAGTFASPYMHSTAYHTQHAGPQHSTPFDAGHADPASAAMAAAAAVSVDHDYSVMAVTGTLPASTPPVHLTHQQPVQHTMHHPALDAGMRFECVLEAPTAAAQKVDEPALTYLNKGQLYGISLQDRTHSEEFFSTTLRITFHEDSHRKGASTYWNFWLNQQENPRTARAVELDKAGSLGVIAAESRLFDRVTFQWQGRRGAKVMIRFNCLSTDFSRIKGVKGIPLRIHLDTCQAIPSHTPRLSINQTVTDFTTSISQLSSPITSMASTSAAAAAAAHVAPVAQTTRSLPGLSGADDPSSAANGGAAGLDPPSSSTAASFPSIPMVSSSGLTAGKIVERCYARVKLFRDKGAERKNKDDQRHMDKMWEKHKAKHALNNSSKSHQQQFNEFSMSFATVQPVTGFIEYTMTGDDCDNEEPMPVDELWATGATAAAADDSPSSMSQLAGLTSMGIGVPGMTLSGLNSPIGATFPRKRSADDSETISPNKRHFSPTSLSSGIHATFASGTAELVGVDPTYVPMPRKNKSVLAIYVKVLGQAVYRAVYLERLAVDDLVSKLTQKLEIQANTDIEVIRRTKKGLTVRVDDNVISQLDDEQDMEIECSFAADTGALTIYLNF